MSYKNFVRTLISSPVSVGDDTINVSEAIAPFLIPPKEGFLTIVDDVEAPNRFEIISYSGITDNGNGTYTLGSVVRGEEDTVGQNWPPNAVVLQSLTAALVSPPITTLVTKTVAADGDPSGVNDFDDFHSAMKWVEKQTTTGSGTITLELNDGTHEVGEPDTLGTGLWGAYYTVSCLVTIISASSDPALCTITMPATDDGGGVWPVMFASGRGAVLSLAAITIDPSVNSYPYPEKVTVVTATQSSSVTLQDGAIVQNASRAVYMWDSASVLLMSCLIDSCARGVWADLSSKIVTLPFAGTNTISNCTDTAITAVHSSTAHIAGITFTGNASDTHSPINEIQYDGSYISDGAAALSFKP